MRKRTSVIWSISRDELSKIVKDNNSLSKVLKYFGLYNKGGNIKTLKRRLEEDKIDYSHIPLGQNSNLGRKIPKKAFPLEQVMVENSTYNRHNLKKRLIRNKLLENKCKICGLGPDWQNKELVMVLDHINGIPNDNRLENLRLLCPNCNSQQSTFCGRKNKKIYYCKKCGKERKTRNSKYCFNCSIKINGYNKRVVKERPSKDILLTEIEKLGYCGVGRKYGVSDSAIRKWIGIKK